MRGSSQADHARTITLIVLALAALHLLRFRELAWAVDDAWISFRIARTWLETGLLTYDASRPPVEGMSNLLWTLLSVSWIAALPSVDPIVPARLLGGGLHLAAVALGCRLAARVAARRGGSPAVAAAVCGALLATSGTLAYYALSGLETPLWAFLFVAAVDRLERALHGESRPEIGGLLLGLLAATRPEGVLIGGLLVGAALARPETRRLGLRAAVPYVVLVGLMEVFRLVYYGDLVPNTFHAKPPAAGDGLTYLGGWLLFGGGAAFVASIPALRGPAVVLGATAGVLAAGAAWSGGDWMPGFRRLTVPTLALALLAGVGAAGGRRYARAAAGLAVACTLLVAARGEDSARFNHALLAELGARAAATPGLEEVALLDIGRFGWAYPGRVYDLAGLTDAHIARMPGKHAEKSWDEGYFRERSPGLLLIRTETPITDPLLQQPVIGRPSRPMLLSVLDNGGYTYAGSVTFAEGKYGMLFRRDDLILPEALWGPPPRKSFRQLLIEASGSG